MKKVIKSISIKDAKKDMILASNIRDKEGNVILPKEHKLDYTDINTITKASVAFIYIYQFISDNGSVTIEKKDSLPKLNNNQELKLLEIKVEQKLKSENKDPNEISHNIDDKAEEIYSVPASPKSKPPLKDVISSEIRKKGEKLVKDIFQNPSNIQFDQATSFVSKIVEDILSTHETVVSVQDLRSYDNYTYQHSLNLCVLGTTVGKLLDYDEQRLREFGIGLLFHDFGKTKIPLEILNKPDRLTNKEFEIMKQHAEYGHQILSKKYKLPEISKMVIRHHHEKLDGSGYPHGLKGKEIPEWVQIATIVDIYDALTADRIYKTQWTHKKAIEFLYDRAENWFNIDYIKLLQATVPEKKESFSLLDF